MRFVRTKFLIILALASSGEAQTKVVIQTEAPAADVYLDGNFVAKTDTHGRLPIENLPPGTFRFAVKKEGYQPYDGSFQIVEGESQTVQAQLRRSETTRRLETPSHAKKRQPEAKTLPPGNAAGVPSQEPPSKQITRDAVPAAAVSDHWPSTSLSVSAALAVILAIVFLFIKRRTRHIPMESPPPDPMDSDDESAGIPAPRIKPLPEFVDQLKRREELIQAGFSSIKAGERDYIDKREKEIVIVLPKEAYTSEEE
jgi:hypothetical protein